MSDCLMRQPSIVMVSCPPSCPICIPCGGKSEGKYRDWRGLQGRRVLRIITRLLILMDRPPISNPTLSATLYLKRFRDLSHPPVSY
jgi:hypothetical protein